MDTNKRILIGAIDTAVVAGGTATGFLPSKTPEKADLPTIHIEAVTEAPKETLPAATQAPRTEKATEGQEDVVSSVSALTEIYTSGKVSTQYLVMDQTDDTLKKDETNELLRTNALPLIKANGIDEANDILDTKCKAVSVDRKRLTATYADILFAKGAAHLTDLFYSNTVGLLQAQNLGLDGFTDVCTTVEYMPSDNVKFSGISPDVEAQVLSYRSSMDLDFLTVVFNSADLLLSSETQWPESFSYEKRGTIYFPLPVPHTLDDYVLVAFDPITEQFSNRG